MKEIQLEETIVQLMLHLIVFLSKPKKLEHKVIVMCEIGRVVLKMLQLLLILKANSNSVIDQTKGRIIRNARV